MTIKLQLPCSIVLLRHGNHDQSCVKADTCTAPTAAAGYNVLMSIELSIYWCQLQTVATIAFYSV
jgi:hypothetical protein